VSTNDTEARRLAALKRYQILDTPPEPAFDRITETAARLFEMPIALLVLLDEDRQWFKSHHGLAVTQTPRAIAFCSHTIGSPNVFVIEDAAQNPQFAANPLVTGEPHIRFYAGAPLTTPEGLNIGTLAIIGRRPGQLSGSDRDLLRAMAGVAMKEIEVRLAKGPGELALEEKDPRLQVLLDQVPAALWTCDRDLQVTSASGAMLASFGLSSITSRPLTSFISGPEGEKILAAQRRALAGEEVNYDTTWSGFVMHAHVRPLLDAAGAIVGTIGIALDMTEHHKMQVRLTQAERLAAVGTLSAGVAHEINNPLTYVNINLALSREAAQAAARSELVTRHPDLAAQLTRIDDLLRDALTGAARVQKIVADLKTFARADFTRADVPADPVSVLEASIAMAMNQIRHVARLERAMQPVPRVALGEGRLAQICLNLLFNAAQAIQEGHVEDHLIRVATRLEGELVAIEISDTGPGIPQEDLDRIFDPFYTTKAAGEGTGLGLSIVRGIVEQAGGSIQVASTAEGATCFCVLLPVSSAPSAAVRPPAAVKPRRCRVLVIEDDEMVACAICRVLEEEHEVVMVGSGRAALELLEVERNFDVILCDMFMTDVGGPELHAVLERIAPPLAERTVFMTGGAFTAGARRFLEEVQRPILTKPFDLGELARLVVRAGSGEI
jgi:PAS domain S-box-containing protein